MTDLDKARALVALRSGITHGNWRYEPSCDGWSAGVSAEDGRAVVWTSDKLHHGVDNPHDAKAIAAVPELLETITSLIADVERMQWQPIETAPEDGTVILGWNKECVVTPIFFSSEYGWSGRTANDERLLVVFPPSHWMPLPEPPTQTGDE